MKRSSFLPFGPPSIGAEERAAVDAVLRSDWLTTGPQTKAFEREFAAFVGAAEGVALSSCTIGLQLALTALEIGAGDVVITSTLTFPGTVNAIEHTGARPLLVDVRPDTLNLDPDAVRRALQNPPGRVRALLPVHYAGHPCDLTALLEIAAANDLAVVEDAAHALPARESGRLIGSWDAGIDAASVPRLASFSFYANKNLTTGEGGMLTGPPELLARVRTLSHHGLSRRDADEHAWNYDVRQPGHKANLTDLQAALGRVQLTRLTAFHQRRAAIAQRYTHGFAACPIVQTPTVRDGCDPAWHLYPLRLELSALRIDRDQFLRELTARNIGASVHFVPVHRHTYYREGYDLKPRDFPVADGAFSRLVSLPIYPRLTDDDVDDVIAAVLAICAEFAA